MLAWEAEKDIDWGVWALTGDYYLREGKLNVVETYGMLDTNWHDARNSSYLQRLSVTQPPHKGILHDQIKNSTININFAKI